MAPGPEKKKKKNRKKNRKKNFFFAKNRKFLKGPKIFFSPIRAHLVSKIAVLWIFRGEKRKFQRKIPRNDHFGVFGRFCKNQFFFDFGSQKHLRNGKKTEIFKKTLSTYAVITTTKIVISNF